jgi:pyruvate/2-oxoacid:ferredoxin oxidoreductase alpha subunit
MMPFEYFLNNGEVKNSSKDPELAKSLIKDMQERIEKVEILDIRIFAKIIFENLYDALRDFCDALLALKGYKSYSHQASISFLSSEGFDTPFIEELDQFRYKRNSSKYYGLGISEQESRQIKEFYKMNKGKINKVIKKYSIK